MSQTVRGLLPEVKNLGVKWPNDVLVNEHKISGVLTEMLPTTNLAVVIGAGINLTQQRNELPIPTATSLKLEGWQVTQNLAEQFDEVLSSYLLNLAELYNRFVAMGMNAVASGIRNQVIDGCITLGREVRAELPNGENLHGRAATIDDSGRLVLEVNGQPVPLSAADIVHLRHN
jgi:BirA family biotin operon repressor/biotin-[acetyl-CoA-carboxylase] ligase